MAWSSIRFVGVTRCVSVGLTGSIGSVAFAGLSMPFTGVSAETVVPPANLVIADLDGDRVEDALVFTSKQTSIAFFEGCADGGFVEDPVFVDAGTSPYAGAVGDLDGDGAPDLVAVAWLGASVFVRLGAGDGTLAPATEWPTPASPRAVEIGDVDGDGLLDLVTLHQDAGMIAIVPGNGDGTFDAAVAFEIAAGTRSFAVADVNGDQRVDVAVPVFDDGAVAIYFGTSTRLLGDPEAFGVGGGPIYVVAADVDANGTVDLVTANFLDSTLSMLWGDGNGSFTRASPVVLERPASQLAAGDLDQTAGLELVATSELPPFDGFDVVTRGDNGTYAVVQEARAPFAQLGFAPTAPVIRDVDRDGTGDLAYVSAFLPRLIIRPGRGDGTVDVPVDFFVGTPGELLVGDLNGDGFDDLIALAASTDRTSAWVNVADTEFELTQVIDGGDVAALGDVDGDGRLDLIRKASGVTIEVRPGNGDGTFGEPDTYDAVEGTTAIVPDDLDGDGRLDVVLGGRSGSTVGVLYGAPGGTLEPMVPVTIGESSQADPDTVAIGDVNGDGVRDFVVRQPLELAITPGMGDRVFGPPTPVSDGLGSVQDLVVTDLDQDGIDDLVFAQGGLAWRRSIGGGAFAPVQTLPTPASLFIRKLTIGDLDRDGDVDVVATGLGTGSSELAVYLGRAGATFEPFVLEMSIAAQSAGIGVFDRACRPSIVGVNEFASSSLVTARVDALSPGDVDCSGAVGFDDLTTLLNAWGPCPTARCRTDVDEDGTVGFGDLIIVLAAWGASG